MTITSTGYIYYDNEGVIHAFGETVDKAFSALEILSDTPHYYMVRSATAALLSLLEDRGGNVAWTICGGVACRLYEAGESEP
jgi:hypothetical protein